MGIINTLIGNVGSQQKQPIPVNYYDLVRPSSVKSFVENNNSYLEAILARISNDVGKGTFTHYKREGSEKVVDIKDEIYLALNVSPNLYQTPINFWSDVVREMLENDVAVVVPRYKNGKLFSLMLADGVGGIDGTRIKLSLNGKEYSAQLGNVFVFENPRTGASTALKQFMDLLNTALNDLGERLTSEGKIDNVLKIPVNTDFDKMNAKYTRRVNEFLESARGGIGFLQQGEEISSLNRPAGVGATQAELDFLKEQLYENYGINKNLLTGDYNEQQYRAYMNSIVTVYTQVIEQELNKKLLTLEQIVAGEKITMNINLFAGASLNDLTQFLDKMRYHGIINANEGREILDMAPVEGLDEYMSNKNAVAVGGGSIADGDDLGGNSNGSE